MIRSTIPWIVAGMTAFLLALPVSAEEKAAASDVSKQTSETLKAIKSYSQDKKDEAVVFGKKLLKETNAKILQLEAKASKASGEVKSKYDTEVADLKVARANAAAELEKMEKESGNAWNDAKQGFADAYKDLQHAYNKAVKHFR